MAQPPLTGKDLEMQNELERRLTPALLSLSSDQISDLMRSCLHQNNEYEGLIEALGGKKEDQRSSEENNQFFSKTMQQVLGVLNGEDTVENDPVTLMEKLSPRSSKEIESLHDLDNTLSLMKSFDTSLIVNENGKILLQVFFEDAKFDLIKSMLRRKVFDIYMICKGENESLIESYAKPLLTDENKQKYDFQAKEIILLYNSLL